MDCFFTTEQLTVGYNGKPLIRDIEIRLGRGQILTLIGPNGSGKSTILKSIARQLDSICGAVYIDGRSTSDMSGKDLSQRLSVMLTERLKTELMTCEDVVSTGRYPYTGMLGILSRGDREKVEEAMRLVNAWELRSQDFTKISDGQRQRVLLARAICQEPQVIVLDEPTSFLDVRYELELLHILRGMAEEKGIGVVMSLHGLAMAQRVSDLVMCVKGNGVSHMGTPREIFRSELIEDLYDLPKGSYNPLFGSFELERPQGEAKVFVIAGGGSGIPQYRMLQKKRIPFVTGILHQNDVDYQVARDLASEVFGERAFENISDKVYRQALQRLEDCETVISCLTGYGETNQRNRLLLERAVELGLAVMESADAL